jgi:repressor LexA
LTNTLLTTRQQAIFDFIRDRIAQAQMPPTRAEICTAFGFASTRAAQKHLQALAEKGVLSLRAGASRGISLTEQVTRQTSLTDQVTRQTSLTEQVTRQTSLTEQVTRQTSLSSNQRKTKVRNMLSLAILGRVAAGKPIGPGLAEDEAIAVDPSLFQPLPDYLLRVRGDSMRDEGIFDQDLVAIKQSSTALHNRIVVARVDDAVTIKKLHLQDGQIWLMPRNPAFAPLQITAQMDFSIEGIYCGLLRRAP